ncbi:MAG: GAF domain-containing protein, partial [Minicystis sp.]
VPQPEATPAKAAPAAAKPAPAQSKAATPAPAATTTAPPAQNKAKPATSAVGKAPTPLPVAVPAKPAKRLSGDDLLSELFESFSDLQFLRDSLEGAEFVLSLALEKLPSEVGIVSFFDMNTREFIIVRQAGSGRSALCLKQPEKAAIAAAVMRRGHAVLVNERSALERAIDDRWKAVGVELKSLICAPVELNGRYLGLIELANPLDGTQFNDGDGNALTYIGQQFAEFVAARGVAIDPAQIRESQSAAEAPPKFAPAKAPSLRPGPMKAPSIPPSRRGR